MHKFLFILFIVTGSTMQLFSQHFEGIILNKTTNQPISNANIKILNSTQGTVSNNNGLFKLKKPNSKNITIRISCLGYESKELILSDSEISKKLELKIQPTSIHLNKSIIVTASKNEIVSFKTPDAVSVLTQKELINNSPRSMAEALIGVTGVWMQKTNHGGGSPFLRGLTGNQTLLLVDGIRINNSTFRYGPNQYFNTIDIFSTKRIEIIRGKGSVLYGSDALGGVINVITRSPSFFSGNTRIKGRAKLKFINKGMEQSGAGELIFQSQNFSILGNISYKNFGDIFAGGNLGFEKPSGYNETGINIKSQLRITKNWLLKSSYQYLIQNHVSRYDQIAQRNYLTYKFDPQIHHLFYSKLEHFGINPFFKKLKFTVSAQISDETRIVQKKESIKLNHENDKVNNYGLSLEINSEFNKHWNAVSGVEYYANLVHSNKIISNITTGETLFQRGLYPDKSKMKNFAIFSHHQLNFNKLNLHYGGRFNTFIIKSVDQLFGKVLLKPNSLVGNLSIQYLVQQSDRFIIGINSAFRAPNINDISSFGLFDYGIEIPAQHLSPEKTVTIEAGYKKLNDRYSFSLFVFNTHINDQIIRVASEYNGSEFLEGERVYTKKNSTQSTIHGIEAECDIKLNNQFSINNNITWLYGKDLETNAPMRRIPPLNGKIALNYSKSKLFTEAEFLFATKQARLSTGDIDDHRIPDGGTPGWGVFNFKLGYILKNITFNSGIQNIFNTGYRLHGSGIDGYGQSIWISMDIQF